MTAVSRRGAARGIAKSSAAGDRRARSPPYDSGSSDRLTAGARAALHATTTAKEGDD